MNFYFMKNNLKLKIKLVWTHCSLPLTLYAHVCVLVCVCVCMCVCTSVHVCAHVCMHAWMCACTWVCVCVCACVHVRMCACACMELKTIESEELILQQIMINVCFVGHPIIVNINILKLYINILKLIGHMPLIGSLIEIFFINLN